MHFAKPFPCYLLIPDLHYFRREISNAKDQGYRQKLAIFPATPPSATSVTPCGNLSSRSVS
jgi:hypothetical protein